MKIQRFDNTGFTGVKKLLIINNPFFVPKTLNSDVIEIGKLVKVPKDSNYVASEVFKCYGEFAGNLKAQEVWFYPGSKIAKTANIDAEEIAFITEKVEKGANIKAKEGWLLQGIKLLEKFKIDIIHETKN